MTLSCNAVSKNFKETAKRPVRHQERGQIKPQDAISGDRMIPGSSRIASERKATTTRPRKSASSNHHRLMVRPYENHATPLTTPVALRRAA